MNDNRSRRFWIVGASSGIGFALAELLLAQGHHVALSARRTESMTTLVQRYPAQAVVMACDITDSLSLGRAVQCIDQQWGAIDSIVVNAGICEYIENGQVDSVLVRRIFDTNFFGAVSVAECAKPLLERGVEPQFAVVSSSAAFLPLPRAEAYGSSKAALNYFFRSLALAWQKQGISVQLICPGFVKTPLTDKNDFPMPAMISTQQAARTIAKGLQTKIGLIHFPQRLTLFLRFLGVLPFSWQQKVTAGLVKS